MQNTMAHRRDVKRGLVWCVILFCCLLAQVPIAAWAQSEILPDGLKPAEQTQTGDTQNSQPAAAAPEIIKTSDVSEPALAATKSARKDIEAGQQELSKAEAIFKREGLSDSDLAQLRAGLTPLMERAQQIAADVSPNVQATRTRLEQLGAPPAEGAESEEVAAERAEISADLAHLEGTVSQARLLATRTQQLADRISERRRALFSERIFERGRSALDPLLWYDAAAQSLVVAGRFWPIMRDWWDKVYGAAGIAELLAVALSLIIIGGTIIPARRLLLRFASRDPGRINPSSLRRTTAAAWLLFVYAAVPIIGLAACLTLLRAFSLLTPEADPIVEKAFRSIVNFSVVQGVFWGLFAPSRPTWRLVQVADAAARRIVVFFLAAAGVLVVSAFFDEVNAVTFAPLSVTVGKQLLASNLIAVFIGFALRSWAATPRIADDKEQTADEHGWSWLIGILWIGLAAIPLASVFGYAALANFIASQFVVGGTILALLLLALRLVDSLLTEGLSDDDSIGTRIGASLGLKHSAIAQVGIVLSGILRLLLTVIAISFLLVPWGVESKDVFGWVRTLFFGFTIGDLTISFSSILLAFGIFAIGLIATRSLQHWLDHSLLPHTRLDSGVRNSINTALGYAGMVIAAAVAVTYVGLDLSNLALVAGALSVGIGFGLQSVVNNFVSGLILLVERPIKTGDWIVVGGEEGYVRKISVRSTEIETFDRASVIIPNSDLISGMVKNWMHLDKLGRISVPIGVDYSADPDQVREILLSCAHSHPAILRRPEPQVFFMNFGESSLDFELRAYVGQVDGGMQARSDLRFAILAALRKADINIPFPQRDLNMRGVERLEKTMDRLVDAVGGTPDTAKHENDKGKD